MNALPAIVYFLVLFNPADCPKCEVSMAGPYGKKTCENLRSAFDQFQLAQCVAFRTKQR